MIQWGNSNLKTHSGGSVQDFYSLLLGTRMQLTANHATGKLLYAKNAYMRVRRQHLV